MKIGIVMPVLHYFKGAVETLESASSRHDLQMYIGPNWREQKQLSKTWNEQIRKARADRCDYILVVNDDILFAPGTIDELVRVLEDSDESVVMASALNLRSDMAEDPYQILDFKPDYDKTVNEAADFSCFLVRPNILDRVGDFDENIKPAYFEDNDFHYRMKLLGLKCLCSNYAPYYHFGSQTQNYNAEAPVVPGPVFEGIRAYYIEKWGGGPGAELFATPFGRADLTPKDWIRR